MTHKTSHFAPVTGFMRQFSLSILFPLIRKTDSADSAPAQHLQFNSSVFSQPDQSELLAMEDEISPLVEAEVYLIYGRKADAEKALELGVKSGRITAWEAAQFWSGQRKAEVRTS